MKSITARVLEARENIIQYSNSTIVLYISENARDINGISRFILRGGYFFTHQFFLVVLVARTERAQSS